MKKSFLRTLALTLALLMLSITAVWADTCSSLIADADTSAPEEGTGEEAASGTETQAETDNAAGSAAETSTEPAAETQTEPAAETPAGPQRTVYTDKSSFVKELRRNLTARATKFDIAFQCSGDISDFLSGAWNSALSHTGKPKEGDYIRWQYSSCRYSWTYEAADDGDYYTVAHFELGYYTTAEQEAQTDAYVKKAMSSLGIKSGESAYSKIKKVYSYVCSHVAYDHAHRSDSSYTLKYTAYAAIVNGKANCQGFSLLVYRMMLAAGVDCRLIPGSTGDGSHGWNIVKIGDLYYNLDATWDTGRNSSSFKYFLAGSDSFSGRTRRSGYTGSFEKSYPMSKKDYVPTLSKPKELKAELDNSKGTVVLSWKAVGDAAGYEICRMSAGGEYASVATASSNSWTDSSVVPGTTYTYKVKALSKKSAELNSGFSDEASCLAKLASVKLTASNVTDTGKNKLSWSGVSGASAYEISRKTGKKGEWQILASVEAKTWTDNSAEAGTSYYYRVRTLSGSNADAASAYSESVGITCAIAQPKLSAASSNDQVQLTWTENENAESYDIYRKEAGDSSWVLVGSAEKSGWVDDSAQAGAEYSYSVQSKSSKSKKATSASSTAVTVFKQLSKPELEGMNISFNGEIRIFWSAIKGATHYEVYRKADGEKDWTLMGKIKETCFSDGSASKTTSYTYKVKALSSKHPDATSKASNEVDMVVSRSGRQCSLVVFFIKWRAE